MTIAAGIHHITAIVGDVRENVEFYAGVLGLRLVKRTVNFDDPGTYHLYFGNEAGAPGTIITFFPWQGAERGTIGFGQTGTTTYVVPEGALPFWEERFQSFGVSVTKTERYGETVLGLVDPHGLRLELVARRSGENSRWESDSITSDVAIKGFGGATLLSQFPQETMNILESLFGFRRFGQDENTVRFITPAALGNTIDVAKDSGARGHMGIGTVHHIAWRAKNREEHLEWRERVIDAGYQTTPVMERNYFQSIYFREKGGILFEIATDSPGFAIDEPFDTMGSRLMLPQWLENHRKEIEAALPALTPPSEGGTIP